MNCVAVEAVLDLYCEDRCTPRLAASVSSHLGSCASCSEKARTLRPARAAAGAAPHALKARLLAALSRMDAAPEPRPLLPRLELAEPISGAGMASLWLRVGESALAALALTLPLAFLLKTTLLQAGALAVLASWTLKGLERGRWELPAKALPIVVPAALLAAWTAGRFALSASPLAGFPGFLRDLLYIGVFLVAMLEQGGAHGAARFRSWTLAAGWATSLYGLWSGFSAAHGLFLAACLPLALSRIVDPERDAWEKALDAAFLLLLAGIAARADSPETAVALAAAGFIAAVVLPALLPLRSKLKVAAAALAIAAAGLSSATHREPQSLMQRMLWMSTAAVIAERPWTGHGPGTMALQLERRKTASWGATAGHDNRPKHAPGLLAEIAAERGLIGASLWLWLFASVLLACWRARRRLADSTPMAGLCAAAATLLVAGQWNTAIHETAPGWLLWPFSGLAAGLALLSGRGAIAALPIPLKDFSRRRLSTGALAAAIALLSFPARWQLSDLRVRAAVQAAQRGDHERAAALALRARPGSERYLEAQALAGVSLLAQDKPNEALERLSFLERLAPDYTQLHYHKGLAFARLGSWDLAAASFERQRRLDPLFLNNLEKLAVAAKELGDYDRAKQAALAALSLAPEDPVRWLAVADVYARQRRMAEARRLRQEAARLRPRQSKTGRPKAG